MSRKSGNELTGIEIRTGEESVNGIRMRVEPSYRVSGTVSDFVLDYGNDGRLQSVKQIQLISASLTNSQPNVTSYNNIISFQFGIAISPYFVNVPIDEYSNSQLMDYIVADVNTHIAPSVMSWSLVNGKNQFSIVGAETFYVIADSGGIAGINLRFSLGFLDPYLQVLGTSQLANARPALQGNTYFHIASRRLSNNNCLKPVPSGNNAGPTNCLFSIPRTGLYNTQTVYQGSPLDRVVFGMSGMNMNNFDLEIRDENDQIMELDPNSKIDIVLRLTT